VSTTNAAPPVDPAQGRGSDQLVRPDSLGALDLDVVADLEVRVGRRCRRKGNLAVRSRRAALVLEGVEAL
jgi:hypothetical protein